MPELATRVFTSFDGTRIAYHATPRRTDNAPTIVLASGLGGTAAAWQPLIAHFADRARFITWDYRGLYASKRPPFEGEGSYDIACHVRDLAMILEREGVERAAMIGWSMGVHVALRAFDALPGKLSALVLMNASSRRPIDSLPKGVLRRATPPLIRLMRRLHPLGTPIVRRLARAHETFVLMRRLGLVAQALDDMALAEMSRALRDLDLDPFLRVLLGIAEHDATDVLERVDVPCLVIAGDRDRIAPLALSQQMARRLPRAETLVVRRGTHYAPVEYPELVNLRIERFLEAAAS
jgi:pimeloyl-ACP methyl ester carboxylesterase